MKDRLLVWPALGVVLALLARDATERSGAWTALGFGLVGAALGVALAYMVRR